MAFCTTILLKLCICSKKKIHYSYYQVHLPQRLLHRHPKLATYSYAHTPCAQILVMLAKVHHVSASAPSYTISSSTPLHSLLEPEQATHYSLKPLHCSTALCRPFPFLRCLHFSFLPF